MANFLMSKLTENDLMSHHDEFYNVKKGLPSYSSRRRSKLFFLILFILIAILLSTLILSIGFLDTIIENLDIGDVYVPVDYQAIILLIFVFFEQVFYVGIV